MPPNVAILGGGITGLTSAFYLSRRFPNALITIFEKSSTLGGWLRSERVAVTPHSSVVLEAGPRTFRPGAKGFMEIIHLLGLTSQMLTTLKSSPATRNRYLHIPPGKGLVAIPHSISDMLTSPLRALLVPPILREAIRAPNRPSSGPDAEDESVDAFLTRRFGAEFARVFGSSLVHGIYAADSRRVSMRAAFGRMRDLEERGLGSVVRGAVRQAVFYRGRETSTDQGYELGKVEEKLKGVSVFSFREGVGMITDRLEQSLRTSRSTRICAGTAVSSLRYDRDAQIFHIATSAGESVSATHVVSALPLPALASILPRAQQLPHITANTSSSVTVINLVFPTSPTKQPIHPNGFGYLIPRPVTGYAKEGSDGILGCVFDSCTISGQDDGAPITKLTLMLGGPHPGHTASLPSILQCLQRHLGLEAPLSEPVLYRIHEHEKCIPVPAVGHLGRMEEMRRVLGHKEWGEGRLDIIGAGVGGVSVPDCVMAGRSAGHEWKF